MLNKTASIAVGLATCVWMGLSGAASAQETCGGLYTVKRGDTLSGIADRMYLDAGKWTSIFQSNAGSIGGRADAIRVGMRLRLNCIDGLPVGLEGGTTLASDTGSSAAPRLIESQGTARRSQPQNSDDAVRIVASDGLRPFADRLTLSSGLISDVVNRSFVNAPNASGHEFLWINDRSAHLDPVLAKGMADVSFPWVRPDCGEGNTSKECVEYVYSEPIFETLILMFKQKGSAHKFNSIEDLQGKRLCRPLGLQLSGLHSRATDLLRNNRLTLMQPRSVEECFQRLVRGEADFVAMNEFTGRVVLSEMGIKDQVEIIVTRPLSIETMHVVAHRDNPRAEQIVSSFNEGLENLRESGEYQAVLEAHLSSIWAGF